MHNILLYSWGYILFSKAYYHIQNEPMYRTMQVCIFIYDILRRHYYHIQNEPMYVLMGLHIYLWHHKGAGCRCRKFPYKASSIRTLFVLFHNLISTKFFTCWSQSKKNFFFSQTDFPYETLQNTWKLMGAMHYLSIYQYS